MKHIGNDFIALKDRQEIKIIRKYAKSGQKYMYGMAGRKSNQMILKVLYRIKDTCA